MCASSGKYPYEKAIVLNALYDALDAMGVTIIQSNSARGTLLVHWKMEVDKEIRIVLSPNLTDDSTLVEIFLADNSPEYEQGAQALLDEIGAVLTKAGMEETKRIQT